MHINYYYSKYFYYEAQYSNTNNSSYEKNILQYLSLFCICLAICRTLVMLIGLYNNDDNKHARFNCPHLVDWKETLYPWCWHLTLPCLLLCQFAMSVMRSFPDKLNRFKRRVNHQKRLLPSFKEIRRTKTPPWILHLRSQMCRF